MTSVRRRLPAALAVLLAVWTALVVVFRSRHQASIDLVRRFNRDVLNPVMARLAGRPGFYAASIHHVGRSSGRPFTTPVVADPVPGGYAIPLPYGRTTDWCKNVLAAGQATLAARGTTVVVVEPEVVGFDDVLPHLTPRRARVYRLYRIDEFLSVKLPPVTEHSVHRVG
jgi:deazaflavin-dependent oxidoreductase (nitroreductase family)